jgi:hypothetical protein
MWPVFVCLLGTGDTAQPEGVLGETIKLAETGVRLQTEALGPTLRGSIGGA